MRRKTTELEQRLNTLGFKLTKKNYSGKHSEKIESYTFEMERGNVTYFVCLNKTREEILNYSFTTNHFMTYTYGVIEGLYDVLSGLEDKLMSIYDFDKKDIVDFPHFVEEALLDE